MTTEQQIKDLRQELRMHNYNYYVLDNPTISDYEFDVKLKELCHKRNINYNELDNDSLIKQMRLSAKKDQHTIDFIHFLTFSLPGRFYFILCIYYLIQK